MREINEMINQFLEERADEYLEETDENNSESSDEALAEKMGKEIEADLREFKKGLSSLCKSIQAEDLTEAREKYKKLDKDLESIEDKIDKMPELPSDNTKGKKIARKLALIAFGISTVVTVAGAAKADNKLVVGGIVGMFGSMKAIALNKTFKSKLRKTLDGYQSSMSFAINALVNAEHEAIKLKNTTYAYNTNTNTNTNNNYNHESAEDVIIRIYDAYESGTITESAMNNLINKVTNKKESDQKKNN